MTETANPVLVEVTRGPAVESRHRASIAVADASGRTVLAIGDVASPVFPRSAVKAFQALPLVESGAAAAFGFSADEIALACSSHNGEDRHVAAARAMLAKTGLGEDALECGPQPPRLDPRPQNAEAIRNNCSGKHAGMLAVAHHLGFDTHGYTAIDHPLQKRVRAVMEEMTGAGLAHVPCGIDGCSLPTWAAPLSAFAHGFARFARGEGLVAGRANAAATIRAAVAEHPFMVAGTGRFCTRVMEIAGAAAFVKTGAEGVFCAAFPDRGLGLALKVDDGGMRAAEALMAAVTGAILGLDAARLSDPVLRNWIGRVVGEIRLPEEMAARIAGALA